MLEIRLERRAEGLCLEAKGHAGCGVRGRDLVCAGASMLAQTLRAALAEAERAGAGDWNRRNCNRGGVYLVQPTGRGMPSGADFRDGARRVCPAGRSGAGGSAAGRQPLSGQYRTEKTARFKERHTALAKMAAQAA